MSKGPIVNNIMNQAKLGAIVKTTRIRMDMTQAEFADVMKVPVSTLNNWESGVNNPPEYFMDLLGIRFEEYLASENEPVLDSSQIIRMDNISEIPNSFIVTSMISMMEQFKAMNEKLSAISDILAYNFEDASELESFDDEDECDDTEVSDADIFCLTPEERAGGKIEDEEQFVDIQMYLASRDMSDDELNANFSPSVIRQLGRTVLSGDEDEISEASKDESDDVDDCDEIDLSDIDSEE